MTMIFVVVVMTIVVEKKQRLNMRSKQIEQGLWKNAVVFFNGVEHKVIDFDGKTTFKIDDEKQESFSKKWIHKSLIVWSR